MAVISKIRVLVIDDSALVRQLLTDILSTDPELEVVGTAPDPYVARQRIKQLNPDVLTLDVEMPRMDGITFLGNLMRLHPLPVVMVSSLTEQGAQVSLNALALGAIDVVAKPRSNLAASLHEYSDEIISKVKTAATANIRAIETNIRKLRVQEKLTADAVLAKRDSADYKVTDKLIAIGASTGGTEAIKDILLQLPAESPGIVITQHIPARFSEAFAARMDRLSALHVSEAVDGAPVLSGHAYVAPGDRHLLIERRGSEYFCRLNDGPPVNRHKPSVDVLFRSVAQCAGPNAVGIILTGMGDDGARGLLEMQVSGAMTIAQDEKSSIIWGMPGEAVRLGAVDHIVPLSSIADRIKFFRQQVAAGR